MKLILPSVSIIFIVVYVLAVFDVLGITINSNISISNSNFMVSLFLGYAMSFLLGWLSGSLYNNTGGK